MRTFVTSFFLAVLVACPQAGPTDAGPSQADASGVSDAGACGGSCSAEQRCFQETCWPACPCVEGSYCEEETQICRTGCLVEADCPLAQRCENEVCIPGCSADDRCHELEICHEGECREPFCTDTANCESGQSCQQGRCEQTDEAPCESAADCGRDWRCSSYGLCFTGDCLVHDDCEVEERCAQSQCIPRPLSEEGILFERRFPGYAGSHSTRLPFRSDTGYGVGGAVLDVDGDGDLDLFFGTTEREGGNATPPCIYENISVPSRVDFRPWAPACPIDDPYIHGAAAVDLEGDGFHELVVYGNLRARLLRFHPHRAEVDLVALLPPPVREGEQLGCIYGAVLAQDLNLDGRIDLLLGCQVGNNFNDFMGTTGVTLHNVAFLQNEDGDLVPVDREDVSAWSDGGSALGIGGLDINNDGLQDLIAVNDTFTTHGVPGSPHESLRAIIQRGLPAPVVYSRCGPQEDCDYQEWNFGDGDPGLGSFMGVGAIHIDGRGEYLYVGDWGSNRLVQFDGEGQLETMPEAYGGSLSHVDDILLFSWGVLVDDFNRDGRDDLLVSQGMVPMNQEGAFEAHFDALLLQEEDQFKVLSEEIGLSPHDRLDSQHETRAYSSRAMIKADFDYDGYLDIVTFSLEGRFRFHAEVPQRNLQNPRCTLNPRPRYVPAFGSGYGLRAEDGNIWRRRDIQGQVRAGLSPMIVNPEGLGTLRFPSGYEMPFDCEGRAGPVDVVEPEWIQISRRSETGLDLKLATDQLRRRTIRVTLDNDVEEQAMRTVELPGGDCEAEPGWCSWDITLNPEDSKVMIRLGEVWVPRWFQL